LHTIDAQVQHADRQSLKKMAAWLIRKWRQAEAKRSEAQKALRESGKSLEFLQEQWDTQVASQTKPLPRKCSSIYLHCAMAPTYFLLSSGQSKNAGKNAVEAALYLHKGRDALKSRVSELEDVIADGSAAFYQIADAELELERLRPKLTNTQSELLRQECALGIDGMSQYRHLVSSPFLQARMNALAIKTRLREKLRARKFELDRIERSFHREQFNGGFLVLSF
jgi:hypothetical protein